MDDGARARALGLRCPGARGPDGGRGGDIGVNAPASLAAGGGGEAFVERDGGLVQPSADREGGRVEASADGVGLAPAVRSFLGLGDVGAEGRQRMMPLERLVSGRQGQER
mmetsp:Transcript_114801/g.245065  ORF Transcript_114801/g.245065 Transcript_114801/m.245065 type:complete len:110 (+) Transcript_114801:1530-1859(+)